MDNCRILVDVDCSRYENDAFSLLDKSAEVNVVSDLKSSTVSAFDQLDYSFVIFRTLLINCYPFQDEFLAP